MCRPLLLTLSLLLLLPATLRAERPPAPFLRRPDIHGDRVVFTAEGDLWLGSIRDHSARRITTHDGLETSAHFSPDGETLAFTAQYDGATEAYVMPVDGGAPRRLTYDPYGCRVVGWAPDGKNVLIRSRRFSPDLRNQLLTIPAAGGLPHPLPIPQVEHAAANPDGKRIAYVPVSAEWQNWKRYQGGQADDLWLADTESVSFKRLTDSPGIDTTPTWVGDTLYFVSERDGLANLFRLDPKSLKVAEVTHYRDYDVRYPSSDGTRVVFQHGAGLAVYDPKSNQAQELSFELNSDRIHTRERRVQAVTQMNTAAIGPTGKRVVIEARGQLLSVPVEEGDVRTLAPMPGSRSTSPVWSPDGKSVAFISDRSGEDQVWIAPANGPGDPRQITRDRQGPLSGLVWAPDGKHLAMSDREMRVLLVDAETGLITTVDQADRGGSYDTWVSSFAFSPDGKWLAYVRPEPNWNWRAYLYSVADQKKIALTNPDLNASDIAFDPTGKYLYVLSDRNLDPAGSDHSHFFTFEKTGKVSLYTLAADTASPFLPANDEEADDTTTPKPEMPKTDTAKTDATKTEEGKTGEGKTGEGKTEPKLPQVKVDLEGLADRVEDVPVPADSYAGIDALEGRLLLVSRGAGGLELKAFDLKKKQTTALTSGVTGVRVSANRKKILLMKGRELSVVDASTGAIAAGTGRVDLGGATLVVQPDGEWKQIFNEAWRIGRDFFYDPNMHGVNWPAVKAKYQSQLAMVADRSDLNSILGDMIAELNIGHAYVGGGDLTSAPTVPNGFLGADLEPAPEGGAYRIVRLLPGDGFDLAARSPLLAPGVKVKPGDYILAIAGQKVSTDHDPQSLLVGTAGRIITVTVNSKPSLEGAREIRIKPLESESSARYYAWVAGRREYVRTHGGENLGYIHIPDMVDRGLQEFGKHYYPNAATQDGMIYDVRNNGGGYISSMLLLQMSSKPYSYFKPRYGASWTRQDWGFPGHSVALCNANSGSNAEEFCDGFQRLKLGPVIGTRTWGGEVGSGGGYRLIDGGSIYIPNYGEWVPGTGWVIEGTGVKPDMEVEEDAAAVMAGRDPQLDRAIAYLQEKLKKEPVARPMPPPFPIKALRQEVKAK